MHRRLNMKTFKTELVELMKKHDMTLYRDECGEDGDDVYFENKQSSGECFYLFEAGINRDGTHNEVTAEQL